MDDKRDPTLERWDADRVGGGRIKFDSAWSKLKAKGYYLKNERGAYWVELDGEPMTERLSASTVDEAIGKLEPYAIKELAWIESQRK